ncbi:MAG: exopolysaccharide Pel transporter PelG [Burkholderiales bacterium]|nr:exopolysaccharide Pel transporter PelG [Burkholderiales bacterium]
MAGIGFEIRKLLRKESYTGLLQAYAYAGIISSGPWVLSIIGILVIGLMSAAVVVPNVLITQFQVSVTYLMVTSLIFTGAVQLAFTRYIADRLFEKKDDLVLPNFNGVLLAIMASGGVLALLAVVFMFPQQSDIYRVLMVAGFVELCGIWVATIFLSGMKLYKEIVQLFALGYAITVVSAYVLRPLGMEGLLFGFVLGHFVLFTGMILMTLRDYPSSRFISFDFARRGAMFPTLIATGLIYNLGIWADKLLFWFNADTSHAVIGPLRASVIYDMPIFLAYLAIIPGMAVFLVRIETDFVEYYTKFYDAVREGGSLDYIEQMRDEMVFTIRQGIYEIIKIQSMAVLVVFVAGPTLLDFLGISQLYLSLLYVDVVAASLQVVLLGLLNIFFYLDKRAEVLLLTTLFLVLNVAFTSMTLLAGAPFYGYGFALSLLATVLVTMLILDGKLQRLEYETFMLQ